MLRWIEDYIEGRASARRTRRIAQLISMARRLAASRPGSSVGAGVDLSATAGRVININVTLRD